MKNNKRILYIRLKRGIAVEGWRSTDVKIMNTICIMNDRFAQFFLPPSAIFRNTSVDFAFVTDILQDDYDSVSPFQNTQHEEVGFIESWNWLAPFSSRSTATEVLHQLRNWSQQPLSRRGDSCLRHTVTVAEMKVSSEYVVQVADVWWT